MINVSNSFSPSFRWHIIGSLLFQNCLFWLGNRNCLRTKLIKFAVIYIFKGLKVVSNLSLAYSVQVINSNVKLNVALTLPITSFTFCEYPFTISKLLIVKLTGRCNEKLRESFYHQIFRMNIYRKVLRQ